MHEEALTAQIALLFERHGALVLRRCHELLKDPDAARDACQEVFVRVMESYDGFRKEASPVTWIYRIATNVCLDELRRQAKRATVRLTPELQEALCSAAPGSEEVAIQHDYLARLFGRTDARSLQIFVHTYQDEMTQEEVAEVMGLSRKTVWTRLQRLRRRLQRGHR